MYSSTWHAVCGRIKQAAVFVGRFVMHVTPAALAFRFASQNLLDWVLFVGSTYIRHAARDWPALPRVAIMKVKARLLVPTLVALRTALII
jgi:hypothetical protein